MISRSTPFLLALAFSLLSLLSSAQAESRIGLILGDGSYSKVPGSAAANNASLVSFALTSAGYKTIEASVISRDGVQWALDLFVRQIEKQGPGSIGFVYFAGHVLAVGGENYLIPTNATVGNSSDAAAQGYPLSLLLAALSEAGGKAIAVALDSCAPNPFYSEDRSLQFASVSPPPGVFLSLCSAPQSPTLRTDQPLSGYSNALAQTMAIPGLTMAELFAYLRWSVARHTEAPQLPWAEFGLAVDVPFSGEEPVARTPGIVQALAETSQYGTAERNAHKSGFLDYLSQFPDGAFARFAQAEIEKRDAENAPQAAASTAAPSRDANTLEELVWASLQQTRDLNVLKEYVARFPDGAHVTEARERIARMEAQAPKPAADKPTVSAATQPGGFTAKLAGTGAPGWANAYLTICGDDTRYDMALTKTNQGWTAKIVHHKSQDVTEFKPRDNRAREGSILLYSKSGAGSERHTSVLRVTPERGTKVTYSIPNAGIGNCAFGFLQ